MDLKLKVHRKEGSVTITPRSPEQKHAGDCDHNKAVVESQNNDTERTVSDGEATTLSFHLEDFKRVSMVMSNTGKQIVLSKFEVSRDTRWKDNLRKPNRIQIRNESGRSISQ